MIDPRDKRAGAGDWITPILLRPQHFPAVQIAAVE